LYLFDLFTEYWICDPLRNPKGHFIKIADWLNEPFGACDCMSFR